MADLASPMCLATSASDQNATIWEGQRMSGLPPKAEVRRTKRHIRFEPTARARPRRDAARSRRKPTASRGIPAISGVAIERRIATATPPNRLATQRRLLQRAGGDAHGWGND